MSNAAPSAARFSVDGKVAIITGAGSGINLEFAKLLLSRDCSVVIGDLSLRPEAQAVLDKYKDKPRCLFRKTDVTDWTSLRSLFKEATSQFGTFDIVCPGAGIFEPHWSNFWHPPGSATSKDSSEGLGHYATLDINLTHPIRATQLAMAEFLQPSNGSAKASTTNPKRIVHIASVAGETSTVAVPIYIASKHAIFGFVRSMARLEQTHGIRVNAVAPGIVRTPLWEDHPEKMSFLGSAVPAWVTPVEVAETMLKLVEEGDMLGGTILECLQNETRVIPEFGNMGPSSSRIETSEGTPSEVEVLGWLGQDGWGKATSQ